MKIMEVSYHIPVNIFSKILLAMNLAIYVQLAIFSYSYVDLNLTISRNTFIINFVSFMQQIGYFHRSLATSIYVIWIISAFSFYILNLWLFYKKKVRENYLKYAVICCTLILIFAYPFLSSDLFNYIFYSKIILKYHANPYAHRALDFPGDDWLRFMRWVHGYAPYGPLWLVGALIPAILGFGKFILNLLMFKIFIGSFHLINSYLIYKILEKTGIKNILLGTSFYALNPLLLIEGVANAHNDIVVASFLLLAVYFYVHKENAKSFAVIFAGALIKYIPILNLPWYIFSLLSRKKANYELIVFLSLATLTIFTFIFSTFAIKVPFVPGGSTQVQFQPWYLFWTLPYIALIPKRPLIILGILVSIGASLRYLPFLFYGDWSHAYTILFMQAATILPLTLGLVVIFIRKLLEKDK